MVPINLELELGQGQVPVIAEQLDQLADASGFMRYQITAGDRRSVVFFNVEEEAKQPLTSQNAERDYEAVHYSGQDSGFSEDEVFSAEEVGMIITAIKAYNDSRKLTFDQMHFDF